MGILEFCGVTKAFGTHRERRTAVDDVTFSVEEGALALLTGPSGAGKSTLLKLVLAMERPETGTIRVGGRDIDRLRKSSIPYLRRNVGAVFQDFKLLQDASPLENVALALQAIGLARREVTTRARAALESVELDPDVRRPCRCLSGGEQQRVAIARALVGDPTI
jgi:cell division transport system ATP-binding protein